MYNSEFISVAVRRVVVYHSTKSVSRFIHGLQLLSIKNLKINCYSRGLQKIDMYSTLLII